MTTPTTMPAQLPSNFPTTIYPSSNFLESCGCILFDFRHTSINPLAPLPSSESISPPPQPHPSILLMYSHPRTHYLLPKGRRNVSEPHALAAVRETTEETGLLVSLVPVTLHSRATSVDPSEDRTDAEGFTLDEVRKFHGVIEPFTLVLRQTSQSLSRTQVPSQDVQQAPVDPSQDGTNGDVMKLIWWYVGVVDEDQGSEEEITRRREGMDPGCEVVGVPMGEAVGRCTFADDARVVKGAIEVEARTFGWDVGGL